MRWSMHLSQRNKTRQRCRPKRFLILLIRRLVVCIEAPATASLNLQQFLDIWGQHFSTLGYQDQLASSTGWTVWVGGKQITGGFSKVVFQPHMAITIAYNSPNVNPDTVYNFAAGL